jgi:hypothetical protein
MNVSYLGEVGVEPGRLDPDRGAALPDDNGVGVDGDVVRFSAVAPAERHIVLVEQLALVLAKLLRVRVVNEDIGWCG